MYVCLLGWCVGVGCLEAPCGRNLRGRRSHLFFSPVASSGLRSFSVFFTIFFCLLSPLFSPTFFFFFFLSGGWLLCDKIQFLWGPFSLWLYLPSLICFPLIYSALYATTNLFPSKCFLWTLSRNRVAHPQLFPLPHTLFLGSFALRLLLFVDRSFSFGVLPSPISPPFNALLPFPFQCSLWLWFWRRQPTSGDSIFGGADGGEAMSCCYLLANHFLVCVVIGSGGPSYACGGTCSLAKKKKGGCFRRILIVWI